MSKKTRKGTKKTSKKSLEDSLDEFSSENLAPTFANFSSAMDSKVLENMNSVPSDYVYSPNIQHSYTEVDINKIEDKKPVPKKEEKKDESNGLITGTRTGDPIFGHNPEDYLQEETPERWIEDPEGLCGDMTLNETENTENTENVPLEDEFSNFDFMVNAMYNFQSFFYNTIDSYLYQSGKITKTGLVEKFEKEKNGFCNCYAQIIKKHGESQVVKVLTDPIFLWGTMSMGIVAAHVKENGLSKGQN